MLDFLSLFCISAQSVSPIGVQVLSGYISSIWDHLYSHTECVEEGTRNVVAEWLGKLCLMLSYPS